MEPARAIALERPSTWPHRPLLAGILNVTPDSFSDGGRNLHWEHAVASGLALIRDGADLLDIGGESTRPKAAPVDASEELRRILPVVRALAGETDVPLCVDTRKPEVAEGALDAGAVWINDVGGLRDPRMIRTIAAHGAGAVILHMLGDPSTMQDAPSYADVVEDVGAFLSERAAAAVEAGIPSQRIWIDPGIGFGKTLEHNLSLLSALSRLAQLGYPLMLGASRKSFIGQLSDDPVDERLAGGLAALEGLLHLPHSIIRTHDVRATRQYLLVRRSIVSGEAERWPEGPRLHP